MKMIARIQTLAGAAALCSLALTAGAAEYQGSSALGFDAADLPPNAKSGECYARVYVPPTFETQTEQVVKAEAGERLEVIPARYETVTEQIQVKPATTRLETVPARYETVDETIQVSPARTEWRKGKCDPKKEVANATGECLCLVDVPAVFKTIHRRVMATPPSTRTIEIPAEYQTITKTVLVTPASERRIAIPAEYATVTRQVGTSPAAMKWVQIDCRTRAALHDESTTKDLQRALKSAGHDPGPIDGVFGAQTRAAMESWQQANGLPTGTLDAATRTGLGLSGA